MSERCNRCGGGFYVPDLGVNFINGAVMVNGVSHGDVCCGCFDELTVAWRTPSAFITSRGLFTNIAARMRKDKRQAVTE